MEDSEVRYWRQTIAMCEKAAEPRRDYWKNLKVRLSADKEKFRIRGVKNPVIISRFYKIVREIIASVAFRNPFLFLKAEEDPADPDSGDVLKDASVILQDFVNDSIEAMRCKQKVRQIIFDALFCYRGWAKFGFYRSGEGGAAPYRGSDVMIDDFTYIRRVRPEDILVDPMAPPEEFYDSRFVIERMFVPIDDVIKDKRFEGFTAQLRGLAKKEGTTSGELFKPLDNNEFGETEVDQQTMLEAFRLANMRRMYEVHDRLGQRRITFIDGIEQPIEEKEHPLLEEMLISTPDPATGKALLARPRDASTGSANVVRRKRFLIEGGLPYFSLAMDTAEQFYGDPVMAYENPIQNAIIRSVSRRMDVLDRFKSLAKVKKSEVEDNTGLVAQLKAAEHGDVLELIDIDALAPLEWGGIPQDQIRIERDMQGYEAETIRTTPDLDVGDATGKALSASAAEVNRELSQEPVEELYLWIARNTMSVLSSDRFQPDHHLLRTTSAQGAEMTNIALKSWHLRGRFNITIAAGSMNVLYEQMHTEKTLNMVQMLRGSPNVDDLELDKYIIRASGEIDPSKLLKDEANTDAAKAAETENMLFIMARHDPGVVPGEDHNTHIALQSPAAIQGHPQFAQLLPVDKETVMKLAEQHVQAHQQALQEEGKRFETLPGGPPSKPDPQGLVAKTQSDAQKTQDTVSKELEDSQR